MSTPSRDRLRGCLLGLAVGDALGAAVEFARPGSFVPVTGFRAGGPHGLGPGEWTDDTSMALALADSIAVAGWDLDDQARRYLEWSEHGRYSVNGRCFDIGIQTSHALSRFRELGDARSCGNPAEQASGNGSLMRLAPVPVRFAGCFPGQVETLAEYAAESCLPTHPSPLCVSACRYLALVLAALAHGKERQAVLDPGWPLLERIGPLHPAVREVAMGSYRRRQPPEIRGGGYVVHCLEAALWAFHDATDFREAVLRAVNLGDDADTTGAVCGQIAGAYWGEGGIPEEWRAGLARRDLLEQALAGLLPGGCTPVWTYWLSPGRILAGALPSSPDPETRRRKLEELLDAGARVFVNLMEADESDHRGRPFEPYEDELRELATRRGVPVRCRRFPVRDMSVPEPARMREILDFLTVEQEEVVYVHCWGGVGRTGTVAGCWLRERGLGPDAALARLAELRRADRERGHRDAPETQAQRAFVREWRPRDNPHADAPAG